MLMVVEASASTIAAPGASSPAVAARLLSLLLLVAPTLSVAAGASGVSGARRDHIHEDHAVLRVDAGGGLVSKSKRGKRGYVGEAPVAPRVRATGDLSGEGTAALGGAATAVVRREPRRGWEEHAEGHPADRRGASQLAGPRASSWPRQAGRPHQWRRTHALLARSNGSNEERLACRSSMKAPDESCPEACPYAAQDREAPCHFYCVEKLECGVYPTMPGEDVADRKLHMCRRCQVNGCERCSQNGEDRCEKCETGFELDSFSGRCVLTDVCQTIPQIFVGVILFIFVFALLWYLDLLRRPAENAEVLKGALTQRDQLKIRDEGRDGRPPLPVWEGWWWKTSVHEDTKAGGPGFLLHMDFQLLLLAWIALATLGWLLFGALTGPTVFTVGLADSTTSMQLCSSIHRGRLARDAILQGKAMFVGVFYLGSVVLFLMFAARQQYKYARLDGHLDSLMDYAAFCTGFPVGEKGVGVEEEYESFFRQVLGEDFVGVSLCWDREDPETAVELANLIEKEEQQREIAPDAAPLHPQGPDRPCTPFARLEAFLGLDAALKVGELPEVMEPIRQEGEASAGGDDSNRKKLLEEVPTAGACYVVCRTQTATKELLKTFHSPDAPRFRCDPAVAGSGHTLRVKAAQSEPSAVRWEAYAKYTQTRALRVMLGCAAILGGLLLWASLFYMPYAYYTYKTFEATGHDVSHAANVVFTLLVIMGNQAMYYLCGFVAEMVRPKLVDKMEKFYIVSYAVATFLNMILDLGVLLFATYFGMVARNVRNDEGVLLSELSSIEAVLESFPLQKFGGRMLYTYNVYGCFLTPFLMEPVFLVLVPWHLGSLLVRSKKVHFREAVSIVKCLPMDLGRYADYVMNATLCVCTLFCASGFVLKSMMGLLAGYSFIYVWDRVRALRYVQWFYYSTNLVDENAHRILALPCAALAACLVFQLRLMRAFGLSDGWTVPMVVLAFAGHFLLHLALLELILRATKPDKETNKNDPTYEEIAKYETIDWFNTNKVHCLRTKYVLQGRQALMWPAQFEVRARRGPPGHGHTDPAEGTEATEVAIGGGTSATPGAPDGAGAGPQALVAEQGGAGAATEPPGAAAAGVEGSSEEAAIAGAPGAGS